MYARLALSSGQNQQGRHRAPADGNANLTEERPLYAPFPLRRERVRFFCSRICLFLRLLVARRTVPSSRPSHTAYVRIRTQLVA